VRGKSLPGTLQRPATVEEGREGAALSCALAAVAEMSARPIAAQIDLCNNFIIRSVLFRFFAFLLQIYNGKWKFANYSFLLSKEIRFV
jgi:hypothetical protein